MFFTVVYDCERLFFGRQIISTRRGFRLHIILVCSLVLCPGKGCSVITTDLDEIRAKSVRKNPKGRNEHKDSNTGRIDGSVWLTKQFACCMGGRCCEVRRPVGIILNQLNQYLHTLKEVNNMTNSVNKSAKWLGLPTWALNAAIALWILGWIFVVAVSR